MRIRRLLSSRMSIDLVPNRTSSQVRYVHRINDVGEVRRLGAGLGKCVKRCGPGVLWRICHRPKSTISNTVAMATPGPTRRPAEATSTRVRPTTLHRIAMGAQLPVIWFSSLGSACLASRLAAACSTHLISLYKRYKSTYLRGRDLQLLKLRNRLLVVIRRGQRILKLLLLCGPHNLAHLVLKALAA